MRFKSEYMIPPPDGLAGDPHVKGHYRIQLHSDGVMDKKMTETGAAMGLLDKNNPNSRTESLGKQNIGGVEAEGTKTTVTIPAGEIGNERPIEIVSERWYSLELQAVVMTRHIDPRFGENSYRLANIDRTEPARSLFEVPAGYRIEEGPFPAQRVDSVFGCSMVTVEALREVCASLALSIAVRDGSSSAHLMPAIPKAIRTTAAAATIQ